jgi:replicative DNA helicase
MRAKGFVDGDAFFPEGFGEEVAVWGTESEVLWSYLEPLHIVGPPGVGKTTLGQRVMLALRVDIPAGAGA